MNRKRLEEKFRKAIILFLICLWLLVSNQLVWAEEILPPAEPTPVETVSLPPAEPIAPPPPETPTVTEALSPTPIPMAVPVSEPTSEEELSSPTATPTPDLSPTPTPTLTGEVADGQVGETTVVTQEATNSVVLVTSGNINETAGGETEESLSPLSESDGLATTPSASVRVSESEQTEQENQANIVNSLEQQTNTGGNSASNNVSDSQIATGNANTTGTVITAVNTNLEGVSFTEYNLEGEHQEDLVLDFSQNCLIDETREEIKTVEQSESFQNNEGALENNLVLSSDSGNNQTNSNTQGDSTIETGEANVAATVLTFFNNNLVGNVSLGVVNIFGNLTGDIVAPKEELEVSTGSDSSDSNEEALTTFKSFQSNEAEIENNLFLTANTGANEGRENTDGKTLIETGEATAEAQTINVVNNNLTEGSWWLVLINEAGEWAGKIFGAPEGANFAASPGVAFEANGEDGITVAGNGGEEQTRESQVTQTNQAQVVNNLELSANSGHNQASRNIGGDSIIKTGNARIVASLINFVNNNISSQSRILITVVNVFGHWTGDFLPPGSEKQSPPPADNDPEDNHDDNQPSSDSQTAAGSESQPSPTPSPLPVAQGRRLTARLVLPEFSEGQVISAQADEKSAMEKPIRINLAWLAVTLPLFFFAGWLKRLIA